MSKQIRNFDDIQFTVIAEKVDDYVMEFVIYDITATDQDGKRFYDRAGATSLPDPVETVEESSPFIQGHVKWDGCSNWFFCMDQMMHACSREDLTRIGDVLGRCWDWADPES